MKLVFGVIATLLLVAVIGIGAWAYTPDLSTSRLKAIYLRPDDQFIDVMGVNLRVRISGPAQAPAVILLHGFGSSLETWEPWAETLSQHFRVIRFDLPGFGLTGTDPSGNYSDARTVQILAALMDHLGLAQASLVGNSLGGKIAWNFAVAYPGRVTKLVLISPDGFASPGFDYNKTPHVPALLNLLPYTLPRIMLRMNLTPAYADPARLTNATVTRYWDMMRGPGDRRAMLARMSQVMLVPPAPLLRQITAPTLLLWGEQDQMIPISNAQDYLQDIPNARLVALPGLGHVPFEEDPAKSLPPVLAFLEGQ